MSSKKIQLLYFASIRQKTILSEETIETHAQTILELWYNIKEKYQLTLDDKLIRFAVNEEYQNMNYQLKDNDSIVFIPPVAGG